MKFLSIILLCVVGAVVYGILHDLVTAHLCVEYFTIGHPPVFPTRNPTLLALGWGVIATWWAGLFIGVLLAIVARLGKWPPFEAKDLVRPLVIVLAAMGVLAALAGWGGHALAVRGYIKLAGPMAQDVPADRQVAFITAGAMHLVSYVAGFTGGIILSVWTLIQRATMTGNRRRAGSTAGATAG